MEDKLIKMKPQDNYNTWWPN